MTPLTDLFETIPTALPFGFDLLLRATIVLAIVQLMLIVLKRRSAASRHFVVTLGLAAVIALPLLMFALPDARIAVLPPSPTESALGSPADTVATPGTWKSGSDAATEAVNFSDFARAISSTGIADRRALTVASTVLWVGDNWQVLALSGLTLIPIVLLSRILLGMIAVWIVARRAEPANDSRMNSELAQAMRRLSVRRPIRMLLSDRINVPLVWGFVSPVLILPSSARNWSQERFRVVILHEVAHVRRFDVLSLITGRFATALYWFHPLSWVLERAGRRECERACDDLVLRSGARASDYADHLLGIAAGEDLAESYASVTLAMARPSELEGRLLSILRAEGERTPVSRRAATLAATAALIMLLPIASIRLTAKPLTTTAEAPPAIDESAAKTLTVAAENPIVIAELETPDFAYQMEREREVMTVKDRKHKEYSSEGEKWFTEAYEYHGADRYDEAIAAFKKAIENGYRVGTSMFNIGCGYAMKGDAENAVRWIDDAFRNGFTKIAMIEKDSDLDPIRSDPRFRGLLRDLRAEYGSSGGRDRSDEATARFAELRASNSENAAAWSNVGLALVRLRQLDDAIYALEQAVRLSAEYSSTTYYNLACARALHGDRQEALASLESALLTGFDGSEKMMNDPDLDPIRGEARFAELRVMSEDLSLWNGSTKKQKRGEDAELDERAHFLGELPRLESVVTKYPEAGRAWFNLGFATIHSGNLDRSRVAFGRALELGYKRATSMYDLACVEALAGNRDAAFDWLYKSEKAGATLGGLSTDEDLDSLRSDPRFEPLLERAAKRESELHQKKEQQKQKQQQYEKQYKEKVKADKDAGWI